MITTPPEELDNPFRSSSPTPPSTALASSSAAPAPADDDNAPLGTAHSTTTSTNPLSHALPPDASDDFPDPDPAKGPPPTYRTDDGRFHSPRQPASPNPVLSSLPDGGRKRAQSVEVLPRDIIQVSGRHCV